MGTVGGLGYTLRIQVAASTYDWTFGDGTGLTGAAAGGPPPTGAVHHVYSTVASRTASVRVSYGATYTVQVPGGGQIGPLAVTGGAVRTLPAATTLAVREAYAGLTR